VDIDFAIAGKIVCPFQRSFAGPKGEGLSLVGVQNNQHAVRRLIIIDKNETVLALVAPDRRRFSDVVVGDTILFWIGKSGLSDRKGLSWFES